MQFPKNIFNNRMLFNMLIMTFLVAGSMTAAFGQRTISVDEKTALAEAATLEQCRNGATPTNPRSGCQVVGGNIGWVTGNAGAANSNWAETQFLAYRMLFSGLTIGSTNTVTIGYDIFHQDVHAIDYLGSYDATEVNADPCVDAGCSAQSMTFPVPEDDVTVTPFITQEAGDFTIWGGTITAAVYEPYIPGSDERQITLTFTAHVENPVLAWGGHVAWRGDWGAGQSAGGISGSPYHMRLIDLNGSGGNQDRSLSADAVLVPGTVQIVKRTLFGGSPIQVNLDFGFSSTAPIMAINFDGSDPDDGVFVLNTQTNAQTPAIVVAQNLGAAHPYTVEEVGMPTSWSLDAVVCVETGQVGFPAVLNTTYTPTGANIIVDEGETIVCTFDNVFTGTTAALGSITGRVTNATGIGVSGATLTLVNAGTGQTVRAITNPFGYYTFENMEVEELYILSVGHKRYNFLDSQRVFTLDGDLVGIDFTSTW